MSRRNERPQGRQPGATGASKQNDFDGVPLVPEQSGKNRRQHRVNHVEQLFNRLRLKRLLAGELQWCAISLGRTKLDFQCSALGLELPGIEQEQNDDATNDDSGTNPGACHGGSTTGPTCDCLAIRQL